MCMPIFCQVFILDYPWLRTSPRDVMPTALRVETGKLNPYPDPSAAFRSSSCSLVKWLAPRNGAVLGA